MLDFSKAQINEKLPPGTTFVFDTTKFQVVTPKEWMENISDGSRAMYEQSTYASDEKVAQSIILLKRLPDNYYIFGWYADLISGGSCWKVPKMASKPKSVLKRLS